MSRILIRDLQGRPVGFLDGDVVRDDTDKIISERIGNDKHTMKLAERGAAMMSERSMLMDLGPGDVTTPTTTHATVSMPELTECVADEASPVRFVGNDRGSFFTQNVNDTLGLVSADTNASGDPTEVPPGFTKSAFITNGYAVAALVPRQTKQNADFDIEELVLRRLIEALRLAREVRIATLLTTATNWAATNRIAATAKWNGVGHVPLTDLFAALLKSAIPSNLLIMPESAAPFFYTDAAVVSYIQAGGQLPRIAFARAKRNINDTPAYVWAPAATVNVALLRSTMDPSKIPSSMTLRWLGEDGSKGERREGILVRKERIPTRDGDWLVCAHNDIEVIPSNQVGAVITGALA